MGPRPQTCEGLVEPPFLSRFPFPSPPRETPMPGPNQLGASCPPPPILLIPLSSPALSSWPTPSFQLFQNLRTLMTPYRVTFESPLELSAQGEFAGLVPSCGVGSRGRWPEPRPRPSCLREADDRDLL